MLCLLLWEYHISLDFFNYMTLLCNGEFLLLYVYHFIHWSYGMKLVLKYFRDKINSEVRKRLWNSQSFPPPSQFSTQTYIFSFRSRQDINPPIENSGPTIVPWMLSLIFSEFGRTYFLNSDVLLMILQNCYCEVCKKHLNCNVIILRDYY